MTATATNSKPTLTLIGREFLRPSPMNPRKHFDQTYLDQLAASIKEKGILEPLLVRRNGKATNAYEIVAGECRYRAAGIADLEKLPCIVRELDDQQTMEIQIIENLHRKDLTPLEEASGFRALIKSNPDKHTAASLGARLGKSARWVWDIMKLLDLIPEAKELLDRGIITVAHAIPISRLTPEQQKKLIALPDRYGSTSRGLFVHQNGLALDAAKDEPKDKYRDWKPVTVRELVDRINTYIRFDINHAAKAAPLLFDEAAEQVAQAEQRPGRGRKVVSITHLSYVQPEAKGDEKTFREGFWKRADGSSGTTKCEHSVLGVVAVGPGQGDVFEVCVNRDKCTVHWGTEIRAKAKRQKEREHGTTSSAKPAGKSQYQIEEERRQAARAKAEERWKTFGPALIKATEEKLHGLTANVPKHIFQWLLKQLSLPKDTQPAGIIRALVIQAVAESFRGNSGNHYPGDYWEKKMVESARAIGVNVKALEPKAEKSTAKPAAKKKAAKKR